MKVTGPDGDNPITDEQIRELRSLGSTPVTGNGIEYACDVALCELDLETSTIQQRRAARARCAAAWNARHGATP